MRKIIYSLTALIIVGAIFYGSHMARADIYGSSLIGWWNFDSNSTSAGAGNTRDVSGNGRNAQTVGTFSMINGQMGQGLAYDATDGNHTNLGASFTQTAETMSAWVYVSSFDNAYEAVIAMDETAPSSANTLLLKSNGKLAIYISCLSAYSFYDGTGANTLTTGRWYNLSLTYDSTNGLIGYVNGTLDGTAGAQGAINFQALAEYWVGSHPNIAGRGVHGYIDDVRIYNRAFTASEIMQLYQNGKHSQVNVF